MSETTDSYTPRLPEIVYAQASPRSVGGTSLFEYDRITASNVRAVFSEDGMIREAESRLRSAGFEIIQSSTTTINIAAPPAVYQEAFHCSLRPEERPVVKAQGQEDTATFVECPETQLPGLIDTAGTAFEDILEGVAIEEPRYFMHDSIGPKRAYWHLDVPGDVSVGCNADKAHRDGITGKGIKVVMVDSGHHAHPFFTERGYRVQPVVLGPGAAHPTQDEIGHGTAESANVFAVAPDAELTMVKMNFANSVGAFNQAVALQPHIISCSWGGDIENGPLSAADNALAAAVAAAVANGIIVVFSAGNGQFGFPGQHPDVISAGGTFMDADGSLQASDYASGFESKVYPGRKVPDLCGLVGMRPRAAYIMLPVQPGDDIDRGLANGGAHPKGDETAADDGWAAISGTSAAAPQLAGACALIKQMVPEASPKDVRDILMDTARDVTAGACHPRPGGHAAGVGSDLATGSGLVDAHRAVLNTMLQSISPDSIRSHGSIKGTHLSIKGTHLSIRAPHLSIRAAPLSIRGTHLGPLRLEIADADGDSSTPWAVSAEGDLQVTVESDNDPNS